MKKFLRSIALVMALLMLSACLSGCNGDNNNYGDYDETAGFKLRLTKNAGVSDELWEEALAKWQSWSKVPIEFEIASAAEATESLDLQIAAGAYPEVILSNAFNATDVSKHAANGILIPLDEFITEENTPNLWKMFQEHPETKAANYLPDGKMYSLPRYKGFLPGYLERVIFINKVWLDKLGLQVPTTIEELKMVLQAFKTGDPNGNGKNDEIPMTFLQGHAYSCPEMMLSAWGYATKSGVFDSYTTIKDGKVYFAPMLDEWKEMIEFYRDLYADGLLDFEAFTHTGEVFTSKLQANESRVGVVWSNMNPMFNREEYIAIGPISAEGYEPEWQINPGAIGLRNLFSITTACKNPKAVMNWIDHFYDVEVSLEFEYGVLGKALNYKNEEGKYTWNEPPAGVSLSTFINENRPFSSVPSYLPDEIFGDTLEISKDLEERVANYELYKDYITDEPWPRPFYSQDETNKLSELQTDIFSLVNEKMAKWIVGAEDVEAGWDAYIETLKRIGVDELVKINQGAYDRFQNNLK